ncbi:hypothetical protein LSTR_LSTR006988 [Laodelphax striatellus]|uniref:Uncharacterized protein n=1 Tax=Laodelphax striatellus TaxID=195883 RepID=A0A482WJV3_LAOST|nr:hypothetical protein LSTR_LSTR006988 [Laodelphax striatellus]
MPPMEVTAGTISMLLIASIGHLTSGSNDKACSNNCSSPISFKDPDVPSIKISQQEKLVTIYRAPPLVVGQAYKVTRKRTMCPVGLEPALDKGCRNLISEPTFPIDQASKFLASPFCWRGPLCPPDTNECDASGTIHCEDNATLSEQSIIKFSYTHMRRVNYFSGSCVQDWNCDITPVNYPLYFDNSNELSIRVYTTGTDGLKKLLSFKTPVVWKDTRGYFNIVPPVPYKSDSKSKAKCLTRDQDVVCITTKSK